jgi:hypothetical protein
MCFSAIGWRSEHRCQQSHDRPNWLRFVAVGWRENGFDDEGARLDRPHLTSASRSGRVARAVVKNHPS